MSKASELFDLIGMEESKVKLSRKTELYILDLLRELFFNVVQEVLDNYVLEDEEVDESDVERVFDEQWDDLGVDSEVKRELLREIYSVLEQQYGKKVV